MDSSGTAWFALLVIFGVIWFFDGRSATTGTFVDHEIWCTAGYSASTKSCNGKWKAGETTYKVFLDKQIVVEQYGASAPSTYKNCSVLNKNNWTCPQGKFFPALTVVNGKVSSSGDGGFHVSWWRYMYTKITGMFPPNLSW